MKKYIGIMSTMALAQGVDLFLHGTIDMIQCNHLLHQAKFLCLLRTESFGSEKVSTTLAFTHAPEYKW